MGPIEHTIFDTERAQRSVGGVYPMGTFVNLTPSDFDQTRTQLYPTQESLGFLNALRERRGTPVLTPTFFRSHPNRSRFITNTRGTVQELTDRYHRAFKVSAQGAELLDPWGNTASNHTLELTEVVDDQGSLYYVFAGGFPMIECKSDQLVNYRQNPYHQNVFTLNPMGGIIYHEASLQALVLALAQDYFHRELTPDQIVDHTKLQVVTSPFYRQGGLMVKQGTSPIRRLATVIKVAATWTPIEVL
ncbi:hypothetical protein DA798_10265 [Lactobacillus sp. PFC-70]|nr:hypothetical protein DA798_10265 [Lactobacillus sp. PFC-70]